MIFSLIVKVTPMVKIQSSGPVTVLWNQIILFFDIQTGWNMSHCLNGTHHPKGRPAPSSHHHWGLPAAKLLYTNVLESFTTCSRLLNRSKFLFSLKSTVNTFPPAPNKANAYYKYAITQISYYSHSAWSSYPNNAGSGSEKSPIQSLSKCVSWTRSISLTWDHVKKATSQSTAHIPALLDLEVKSSDLNLFFNFYLIFFLFKRFLFFLL